MKLLTYSVWFLVVIVSIHSARIQRNVCSIEETADTSVNGKSMTTGTQASSEAECAAECVDSCVDTWFSHGFCFMFSSPVIDIAASNDKQSCFDTCQNSVNCRTVIFNSQMNFCMQLDEPMSALQPMDFAGSTLGSKIC